MNYVYLLILLALLQYAYFTANVGKARGKYKIQAPSVSGHETFERVFRVQQNSLEQLVVFIPGMLLFAHFVSPLWALLPGALYVIGRQIYSYLYISDPAKRGPGAVLSLLSNVVLVVGALIGLVVELVLAR